MDKSSITWTRGADWWLSRTTMGGKERYPKQIRVGDLDRPRVYYPVDREALLDVLDEMDVTVRYAGPDVERDCVEAWARRIREALGA